MSIFAGGGRAEPEAPVVGGVCPPQPWGTRTTMASSTAVSPARLHLPAAVPPARGPLSRRLLEVLREPAHVIPDAPWPVDTAEPVTDEDLQLTLYLLYELPLRGLQGVDDRWEWNPSLLQVRAALEERFESALRERIGRPAPVAPDDMDLALRAVIDADTAPALSRFLETQGDHDQFREFIVHRSAYQLKEADPHSWAIPRLAGGPKVAMLEIQMDEYGSGRAERSHAQLFADTMAEMDIDATPGAHLAAIPGVTLATVNLISLLGLHRRLLGALVGHLAVFEMTSSIPNRRYGNGLRRLGLASATEFFDEHVVADAVHESVAAVDLAGGLARQQPQLTPDILFGAAAMVHVEACWAEHVMSAWRAGRSSLLPADGGPSSGAGAR